MNKKIIKKDVGDAIKKTINTLWEKIKSNKGVEKEEDKKELKKFKFVISTETIDRHGDIVYQDGIDLKNFMKNPVLLTDHSYTVKSIGGAFTKIYKENGKTIGEGNFSTTEAGILASELYELGMLKTVSVGFIPLEYGKTKNQKGEEITDYTKILRSELLEVSVVAVPANPDALAILEEKGILSKCINKNFINFVKKEEKQENNEDTEKKENKDLEKTVKNIVENILMKIFKVKAVEDIIIPEEKITEEIKEKPVEKEEVTKSLFDIKKEAQQIAKGLSEMLREAKKFKD